MSGEGGPHGSLSPFACGYTPSVVHRTANVADPEASGRAGVQHARVMARARNIMVGFDGSEGADRALERAAELLGYGSILTVVTVSNNGTSSSETVERAREQLLRRQLSATYLERRGDPTSVLVDSAEAIGADLVVVGRTRNRPPAADGLGTVSAGVVRSAPCDVLVVS